MDTFELIDIVNRTLDQVRAEQRISSDEALARYLGVSNVAVYRWRNGVLPKAARILLPLVTKQSFAPALSDAAPTHHIPRL